MFGWTPGSQSDMHDKMWPAHISKKNHTSQRKGHALVWIALVGTCFCLAPYVWAQNLIRNGEFEIPPFAPSSTLTYWTVAGTGHVHEAEEGSTTPTHSAALSIGHDSEGTIISQSFATAVGERYRVDFDSGISGQRSGDPLQLNVQVSGASTLLNETVTPPDAFTFDPDAVVLHHYSFTFTADSRTATIQFSDIGLGNIYADILVDTVAVTPDENLLTNGDFETPPFDTNATAFGWTVGGSVIDRSEQGSAGGLHAAAFNAGGDSEGDTLSQSFSTSVGQIYTLDFYAGVAGVPDNGSTLQLNVQVLGMTTLVDATITPPVEGTSDANLVRFQHYQFTFTADSTTTTLTFTDIGTGNALADTMLDTVSVNPQGTQLTNGDFETPPFDTHQATGWMIGGTGRIEEKMDGATTPTHSAAFGTGGNYQNSILSQSFSTLPGRQYVLDFDSGVIGQRYGPRLQMQIQVAGENGNLLSTTITPPDAFTYDPNLVLFNHYQFLFIANSATTALNFQDLGTGNDNADSLVDTVSVLLAPPASFARWQAAHFSQSQLNDPSISGWDADPDLDKVANGLEYFFNTDPLTGTSGAAAASLPKIEISTVGPSRYLTFTYHRLIAWNGPPEVVEVSDDLVTWDDTGNQVEQVSGPTPAGDGSTETVTIRLKTPITQGPIPRKFLRLQLMQ